jgi:hypothetical protein
MFVLMNPSTADPLVDDPTVAKCRRLAVKWGYGRMHVGNTFAYRATDQGRLTEVEDPTGPDNDQHLLEMAMDSAKVIFAYGQPKHRRLKDRGPAVVKLFGKTIEPARQRASLCLASLEERNSVPSAIPARNSEAGFMETMKLALRP